MSAELGPSYDSFAAQVAVFPFSRLTAATNKALKSVVDTADLYLHLSALQANPDSPNSALNFVWLTDPSGVRSRPTNVDSWFSGSLRFNIDMMQNLIRSSSVACLEQHQSEIIPFYKAPIDIVINSVIDQLPLVPGAFPNSVAAVPGTVGHTNYFVQLLNSCAAVPAAATETCIKSFVSSFLWLLFSPITRHSVTAHYQRQLRQLQLCLRFPRLLRMANYGSIIG